MVIMKRLRSKRWCFTLNNPTEEEKEFILQQILDFEKEERQRQWNLTYLCFGEEKVSTDHYQGYVELSQKTSLSMMKTFLQRAHWEVSKGNSKQASDYCKKDGNYKEAGQLMRQGKRTDLDVIKKDIENGATEEDIANSYFGLWVVYRRSFQRYATLQAVDRSWKPVTHVYWGKTGTGKTRFVMDQIQDSDFFIPGDYTWFDGYTGQRIVILDDYRGEYKIQLLLKLLDRYPMSVPIKGGFVKWAPTKVYITSNIHPKMWYPVADPFSVAAMNRRFDLVEAVFDSLY